MTRDRLVEAGGGALIAGLLLTLAVASLVVPRREPRSAVSASGPLAVARAAPPARGLARGDAIVSIERETAAPTVVPTPAPTVAPTPEPTATRAPAAPVSTPRAVAVAVTQATLDAERRMVELMNASRVAGGLVPLAVDARVVETARRHSAAEATVRYVYHDGPDGTAKARNTAACGTGWYGENTGKVWNGDVDALHAEFMSEPWEPINHRTNIMDPAFRRVGVGAARGPDALYMTMVFCR